MFYVHELGPVDERQPARGRYPQKLGEVTVGAAECLGHRREHSVAEDLLNQSLGAFTSERFPHRRGIEERSVEIEVDLSQPHSSPIAKPKRET